MTRRTSIRTAAVLAMIFLACSTARAAVGQPTVLFELLPPSAADEQPEGAAAPDSMVADTLAADSVAVPAAVAPPVAGSSASRPGIGARTKRAVGNFFSDGWYIASSPARAGGTDFLWIGAAIGAEAVLFANDQEIFDAVRREQDSPVLKEVLQLGSNIEPVGFMGKTIPFYLAALGAGYAFDVRPLRTIPAEIIESHLLAGGFRNLGKLLVGRKHPYENEGPYEFKFGKGTSFPSGHTSVAFELATIASMNAKSLPVTIAAYSLATTIAVERVNSRNHWPSDVFIAATYGTLVARTVVNLHEKRTREGAASVSILPEFSDEGRVVGVRVARSF